jgi:hypothetical protein
MQWQSVAGDLLITVATYSERLVRGVEDCVGTSRTVNMTNTSI